MKVSAISLRNFRNHLDSHLELGPRVNVLLGDNGQGKTNVLEGLAYLSLTKSFSGAHDAAVLNSRRDFFELVGTILTDEGLENKVRVTYSRDTREKRFTINELRPARLALVIGRFPMVVLSPVHGSITAGAPVDRRRFMDVILAQTSASYLNDLLEYGRVLKHRNRILSEGRLYGRITTDLLNPWNASLVEYGSRIVACRQKFAREFETYLQKTYHDLVDNKEEPALEYICHYRGLDAGSVAAAMSALVMEKCKEEYRCGTTLVGPHRDDLAMSINGGQLKAFASQGQHKTFLIALKVAEFHYLKELTGEVPLLILDDVFSELDRHRGQRIMNLLDDLGQTMITSTDETVFRGAIGWDGENRRFHVEAGSCRPD
jgi:DNA replication and repair protein RecF